MTARHAATGVLWATMAGLVAAATTAATTQTTAATGAAQTLLRLDRTVDAFSTVLAAQPAGSRLLEATATEAAFIDTTRSSASQLVQLRATREGLEVETHTPSRGQPAAATTPADFRGPAARVYRAPGHLVGPTLRYYDSDGAELLPDVSGHLDAAALDRVRTVAVTAHLRAAGAQVTADRWVPLADQNGGAR